jgi:hypothetical protein
MSTTRRQRLKASAPHLTAGYSPEFVAMMQGGAGALGRHRPGRQDVR